MFISHVNSMDFLYSLQQGFNLCNKVPNFALIFKSRALLLFFLFAWLWYILQESQFWFYFSQVVSVKVHPVKNYTFVLQMWARFIGFPQSIYKLANT